MPLVAPRVFVIGAVTLVWLGLYVGRMSRGSWTSFALLTLPCQLAAAWFVSGRRLPAFAPPTVIAALFGGSFTGLALALSEGSGVIVLVASPFVGMLFGLLLAPFALVLQLPMHVACGRARVHPSRDAEDANLLVAGGWLAVTSVLFAVGALMDGSPSVLAVLAPVVTFAIGAGACFVSNRRLRALAELTQRLREGKEPDHRLVPIETHVGPRPEPLWRSCSIPNEGDYDVVVLRKANATYRDDSGEIAIGILPAVFDRSVLGRYCAAGQGGRAIVLAAIGWLLSVIGFAGALIYLAMQLAYAY